MRRCKIVTWIVILSIVNFALGAPAAVRERLEMPVDVDVAEGGTATSQKRYDPLDDWSTTNSADRPHAPPNPTPSEMERLWEDSEIAEQDLDLFCSESPRECFGSTESVGSNRPSYAPSNPGSPTGSHPGSTGGSPLPPLPHPGPSEDRSPSPPGFSVNPDTLSSTGHQPTPPQSPTGSSPGSSEDRSPSPPGGPDEFLDDLLKGKIKRRISGSGTVNSAQRYPRSTNIPTR